MAGAYALIGRRYGIDIAESCAARIVSHRHGAARPDRSAVAFRPHQSSARSGALAGSWPTFSARAQAGAIFDDLWEHFARPGNWRLFDDAAPVWQALIAAGVTIGIASNFDDRLDGICKTLAPLSECRHVFVSSRVGWRKPRPEFFAAIAHELGFQPAEMLLVGDDLENDFRAARAAGWQAVLVDRSAGRAWQRIGVEQLLAGGGPVP